MGWPSVAVDGAVGGAAVVGMTGTGGVEQIFVYGTLRHLPLLEVVLGRAASGQAAVLPGHGAFTLAGQDYPIIVPVAGQAAGGLLVDILTPGELGRLWFYEGGFTARSCRVELAAGGAAQALVFFPDPDTDLPGAPWDLAAWQARCGAVAVEAGRDLMAAYGTPQAEAALRRYGMLLIRAASRLRAQSDADPATLRRANLAGDIVVEAMAQPYAKFFAVEEYDLRHVRFDGADSGSLNRAVFISGDAATVLPYDPLRDRVMVVEQFRPGPFARGDRQPWQLEPIAGRIDPFETAEQAARREALEEAGITLQALLPIANYYPSPGAKTEFLYTFIGLADLPDTAAGMGGLLEEGEDIRAHLIGFDDLMALIESGEVANAPLILSALWLAPRRAKLRAEAAAQTGTS